jgi:hypothetical protein
MMLKIGKLGFDINNLPEGIWSTFSEGVKFQIRKLTREAAAAIRKPFTKLEMEVDPASRKTVAVEKIEQEGLEDALAMYVIQDFEGVGDDEGNPLPNNLESRKRIMNHPQLRDWIWAVAQSIELISKAEQEEEGKN